MQVGLTDLLREKYGIVPAGFVGHSAGEVACAYADGGLTREQASAALLCSSVQGYSCKGQQLNCCLPICQDAGRLDTSTCAVISLAATVQPCTRHSLS